MADGQDKLTWRKSRSCATNACVEIARDGGQFLVRDSAHPDGPWLSFGANDWMSFIAAVQSGGDGSLTVERKRM